MDGTRAIVRGRRSCEIRTFVDPPDRVQLALAKSAGSRSAAIPWVLGRKPRVTSHASDPTERAKGVDWDVPGYFLFPFIGAGTTAPRSITRQMIPGIRETTVVSDCASVAIVPVVWVVAEQCRYRCFARVPGRPAGQGPEVAQLLLAGRWHASRECQGDSSPFDHAANHSVGSRRGGCRFQPISWRNARVTVPRATRGTPPLIRTTKTDRGRSAVQMPTHQAASPSCTLTTELHARRTHDDLDVSG